MGQIVMLPFLAQGHFNSFVNLANLILHHHPSHTITIATTPSNLPKLRSMLSPSMPIQLAALPFDPTVHGLPPHGECTDALPSHLKNRLLGATFTLRPAFEQLLSGIAAANSGHHQPLSVISDTFCAWSVDVAAKLGIFHAVLTTCGAQATVTTFSMWLHLPNLNSGSDEFELPGFPEIRLHRSQLNDNIKAADGTDYCSVLYRSYIKSSLRSSCMLVNSVEEIETKGVERLRVMCGNKPVWCIGPLVSSFLFDGTELSKATIDEKLRKKPGVSKEELMVTDWLHLHPPGSVLYVSFGSECTISSSQMKELAMGLEESEVNFIWVVRPPAEYLKPEKDLRSPAWLPEGFEERMRVAKQGLVVKNWAPQCTILAHESTGGFLSHCGWNSVMESLSYGVAIIGWPMAAEQFYNSKMLVEEMGVCVEVARGNRAEISREQVARAVKLVMGETEGGKELRRQAGRFREMISRAVRSKRSGDHRHGSVQSSASALDQFINAAMGASNGIAPAG
ncbi:UDP-glycosyltransferase 92A1-like [Nymphaea colorata]|uniref:Glycosyltransferase N-terminal domain-containing protein n=1 Tax=Nymphaea colorata TaxID=210225 RepID=A0A5K0V6H1_9MAGN|nr:UDP-glycosyltransferase 92A1-like [Nymphaea colorata]